MKYAFEQSEMSGRPHVVGSGFGGSKGRNDKGLMPRRCGQKTLIWRRFGINARPVMINYLFWTICSMGKNRN